MWAQESYLWAGLSLVQLATQFTTSVDQRLRCANSASAGTGFFSIETGLCLDGRTGSSCDQAKAKLPMNPDPSTERSPRGSHLILKGL